MLPLVSIVLPCYNEGQNLYKNIKFLRGFLAMRLPEVRCEYILINDGSTDNTKDIVLKSSHFFKDVKAVSYKKNRGKGFAIKKGIEKTSGEIIALYDSDLDIEPECLAEHIEHLLIHDNSKIVIGTKKTKESNVKRSLKRSVISEVNIQINNILFDLPVKDTQTGLKVFRRSIKPIFLNHVTTLGYAFDIEFLYYVSQRGYKIDSLPVKLKIDNGNSGVNSSTIFIFLQDIIILFKKIDYRLRRKKIGLRTRCRLYLARFIIFPIERVVNFIDPASKKKKIKI